MKSSRKQQGMSIVCTFIQPIYTSCCVLFMFYVDMNDCIPTGLLLVWTDINSYTLTSTSLLLIGVVILLLFYYLFVCCYLEHVCACGCSNQIDGSYTNDMFPSFVVCSANEQYYWRRYYCNSITWTTNVFAFIIYFNIQ